MDTFQCKLCYGLAYMSPYRGNGLHDNKRNQSFWILSSYAQILSVLSSGRFARAIMSVCLQRHQEYQAILSERIRNLKDALQSEQLLSLHKQVLTREQILTAVVLYVTIYNMVTLLIQPILHRKHFSLGTHQSAHLKHNSPFRI